MTDGIRACLTKGHTVHRAAERGLTSFRLIAEVDFASMQYSVG